jgi:hypothetical protein
VGEWTVKQALTWAGVQLPPRAERLARQRRHATQQRLTARVAQLGFADLTAYLADRLPVRGLLLAEVTAERGAHRVTVRRLMDEYGIRRVRRIPREQAASGRGRRAQAGAWQARRTARLAELGFQDLTPTCSGAMSSRAGRSGGCGRSFGSGAAGWSPSWHGWASGADTAGPGAPGQAALALLSRHAPVLPSHVAWS